MKQLMRVPWLTMLGLLAAAPAVVAATTNHAPAGILASNTPFATEYYIRRLRPARPDGVHRRGGARRRTRRSGCG